MKTAKIKPAMVWLDCPHCEDGFIAHPETGSSMWEVNSPVAEASLPCNDCGTQVRIPKMLRRQGE